MNKIETAIEHTKMELKRLRTNKMLFESQIETVENLLDVLENIDRSLSIPHQEDIPNQTPPPIIHE
jgi:hypothetical protein